MLALKAQVRNGRFVIDERAAREFLAQLRAKNA